MSRSPSNFRQRDLQAALAAAAAAGLRVTAIEIVENKITLTTAETTDDKTDTSNANTSWDEVLSK